MPSFGTIADRIAERYVGLVGGTALAVRSATADLPNHIGGATPLALVFPDSGTFEPGNGTRFARTEWLVRIYYDQVGSGDLARDTAALLDLASVGSDVHGSALALAGAVVAVRTIAWRMGILRYGGVSFTGLEFRLETITTEPWTPTA